MRKEEVEKYIQEFKRENSGLKDLRFKAFESIDEAFPNLSKSDRENLRFKGAYYPSKQVVIVIANEHKDYTDLNRTLKHEVYGHHGINHLTEEQKKELLQKIIDSPSNSPIGIFRDNLLKNGYENLKDKPMILAEETYAHLVEKLPNSKEVFKGIPEISEIKTGQEIVDVIRSVKNSIQSEELEHQIIPARDDLQFKKDIALERPK